MPPSAILPGLGLHIGVTLQPHSLCEVPTNTWVTAQRGSVIHVISINVDFEC